MVARVEAVSKSGRFHPQRFEVESSEKVCFQTSYLFFFILERLLVQVVPGVKRGCHFKGIRVKIRYLHLLEIDFPLILQY